jgi:hypothetical protein
MGVMTPPSRKSCYNFRVTEINRVVDGDTIDATHWLKDKLEGAIDGDDELTIRTELKGGVGKYGRLLGWLYVGDEQVSLNEQMITEGYAWDYDGGTKKKDFEELREIRRSFGTLDEG